MIMYNAQNRRFMFLIENFAFKSQHSLHLIAVWIYNLLLSVGNFIFLDYLPLTKALFKLLFFICSFMMLLLIIITILHSISFFESTIFTFYCTQFIFSFFSMLPFFTQKFYTSHKLLIPEENFANVEKFMY
jgi:hypothetical protein